MAATLSPSKIFALFFIPRLALAIMFTQLGYLGSGGDAETYHILGTYTHDLWIQPYAADLEDLLDKWWTDSDSELTQKYSLIADDAETGTWRFLSDTAPIVWLHAVLYLLWRTPLTFVAATSLLSSAAYLYFSSRLRIHTAPQLMLYALNPVSIYFAATHYKESICESLIVALMGALAARPSYLFALLLSLAFGAFRNSYLPLIPLIWLMPFFSRFDSRLVIFGTLSLLAIAPSLYWGVGDGSHGTLYSIVHMNEATRRILGPLVGLIMPLPFVESATSPFGAFLVAYSFYYWYLLPAVLLYVAFFRRPEGAATVSILIALLISYYTLGGISAKARFFAPFMPILILAFTFVRGSVAAWLVTRLQRLPHEAR